MIRRPLARELTIGTALLMGDVTVEKHSFDDYGIFWKELAGCVSRRTATMRTINGSCNEKSSFLANGQWQIRGD